MENKEINKIEDLNEFIEKMDNMKKQDKMDLSSDQDLSIAIMNLIGVEEHLFFTAEKTGSKKYYDILNEVRETRKELLKKIIKDPEGEIWCISKHLLAASYRLMEVGTKQLSMDKKTEAYEFFEKAYNMYALFWGLNMNLIKPSEAEKIKNETMGEDEEVKKDNENKDGNDDKNNGEKSESKTMMCKLGNAVKKGINCCLE